MTSNYGADLASPNVFSVALKGELVEIARGVSSCEVFITFGIDLIKIYELDGHAIDSETIGRYGRGLPPRYCLRRLSRR